MTTVRYSPLGEQFADPSVIFDELKTLVAAGDFTLGKPVAEFEEKFADIMGAKHALGVGSGTDALKIALRAAGVKQGEEVITSANTFWATVGAIAELGATPVFVDCDDTFCTDTNLIEAAITEKTSAIVPVHLTGEACNMTRVMDIARANGLKVVEDSCQCQLAEWDGRKVGTFGDAGTFSMHPLKIINVWGDAGVIVTNDDDLADQVKLLRNHGLKNRDEMVLLGYNSRLDSTQAVVGKWILDQVQWITDRRRENAARMDEGLTGLPGIRIPPRLSNSRHVYLLYIVFAERRDELLAHCLEKGIDVKIHYPIPVYQQEALKFLGHKPGDFPVSDRHARETITFPIDQHLSEENIDCMIEVVREFVF